MAELGDREAGELREATDRDEGSAGTVVGHGPQSPTLIRVRVKALGNDDRSQPANPICFPVPLWDGACQDAADLPE